MARQRYEFYDRPTDHDDDVIWPPGEDGTVTPPSRLTAFFETPIPGGLLGFSSRKAKRFVFSICSHEPMETLSHVSKGTGSLVEKQSGFEESPLPYGRLHVLPRRSKRRK